MSAVLPRLPVTVVTGFLGSGKTTLLRHLLLNSGQRLAVVVNEFGEVGLDGDLLRACGFCPEEERDGRLVELANGCLCCTVQDDFLPTMELLLQRADQLDGVLVETSGLALPEPLVAAFNWPEIRTRTRVQAVVTVVDGEALAMGHVVGDSAALEAQRQADPSLDHLDAIEDLFDDQLRAADLVLISRSDRLEAASLQAVVSAVQPHCRPGTTVLPMAAGVVQPELVLSLDLDHADDQADGLDHDDHDHHDHAHVAIEAVALELEGHWSRHGLEQVLNDLISSALVIRAKGTLQLPGKDRLLQIQAVGPRLQCWFEGEPATAGDGSAPAPLRLVLLGFNLDRSALEQALLAAAQPVL